MRFETKARTHTHSNIALSQKRRHFRFTVGHFLKEIGCLIITIAVAKIFHDAGREVIGDNACDLNFRLGTKLPAFRKESLGSLKETQFGVGCGDWFELAVSL